MKQVLIHVTITIERDHVVFADTIGQAKKQVREEAMRQYNVPRRAISDKVVAAQEELPCSN